MARPKKERPEPEVCTCGCTPVVSHKRGGGWIVACPALEGCTNNRNAGSWSKRDDAVLDWNEKTAAERLRLKKLKGSDKNDTPRKRH